MISNLKLNSGIYCQISHNEQISQQQLTDVLNCKKFKDWFSQLDQDKINIKNLHIHSVYYFGKNVGFVNLELLASLNGQNEKILPGYVFLRGHAICILVIVNEKYILLTKQFRIPSGKFNLEAPAGMLDEQGDFKGVAAKEMEEETGIKINKNELQYLGEYYPSAGGSDEKIILYSYNVTMTPEEINEIQKQQFGHEEEGESIKIKIIEFTPQNVFNTKDSKLIVAAFAYWNNIRN